MNPETLRLIAPLSLATTHYDGRVEVKHSVFDEHVLGDSKSIQEVADNVIDGFGRAWCGSRFDHFEKVTTSAGHGWPWEMCGYRCKTSDAKVRLQLFDEFIEDYRNQAWKDCHVIDPDSKKLVQAFIYPKKGQWVKSASLPGKS